ncbi:MAG: methyltransferase [Gammaproteobacteria bacterium]
MTAKRWEQTRVAPDGTHHLLGGRPLYKKRFLRALAFHAPGLAAVRETRGAYHIDIRGVPAYPRMFADAAGFYENLSAVRTEKGWRHIHPDGTPAYRARYAWCGNFQGERAVVRARAGYRHILPDGRALYGGSFLYAGDFRERRAVVRLHDGLCAHICEDGGFAHSARYLDLDAYHKGFARARDERGWMHVGGDGKPAYQKRFAAAEPFYNGRALAETFAGEIVTIDASGNNTDVILKGARSAENVPRGQGRDAFGELSSDMVGYWKTFALAAAVRLGVAEKFPVADGAPGAGLKLPEENARVLICALAELGVVEKAGEEWRLTEKGNLLRARHPVSLAAAAPAWAAFAEAGAARWIRAARDAKSANLFARYAGKKKTGAMMHGMLASYARHDYAAIADALPADGVRRLIDAGGGDGTTANLIADARKNVHVVVLDRPEILPLFKKNVGTRSRITFHPGNLFSPWKKKADAVLLARVLHDWDDARALRILRNAHAALRPGGFLFVAELIKRDSAADGLCSFHLLTICGGRERTRAEYRDMMSGGGFRFLRSRSLRGDICLLTGEAK